MNPGLKSLTSVERSLLVAPFAARVGINIRSFDSATLRSGLWRAAQAPRNHRKLRPMGSSTLSRLVEERPFMAASRWILEGRASARALKRVPIRMLTRL
jgi:hypothetical protein